LTRSIQAMDKELARREKADPRAERFRTMPQVGRTASLTFVAAVDDVRRFGSSGKLVSYSGLCPTVRSSGERTEYGSITRQGRAERRVVWVQLAHRVVRDRHRDSARRRAWYANSARIVWLGRHRASHDKESGRPGETGPA
jgi:transposase